MVDLGQNLDVVVPVFRPLAASLAEVSRQVPEVFRARLDRDTSEFLEDRTEITSAVPRQDHAIDVLGNQQMTSDPFRRHQRGHRDRQHGDLRQESSPRSQFGQDLPERELGQASGHEEIARAIHALPH